ncbi:hypothetical protein ERJ75_000027700 [Trypanosoma vivax]|nr:hypothetical protein ERJ75_000027700 [Trypanosoma vivax]
MTSGVVKRFVLPLLDAQPERAHVAQERYSFDACASAKTWGAFLRCLPSTASHIIVQPFDTQLEFLAANHTEGAANSKVIAQRGDLLFVHRKQLQALGGCSLAPATVGPPLPGKVIEAKPFKQMCLLADQLSLMIRVRSGAEDVPLFIMAVTREEAQRAATCNAPAFAKGAMASGALPNRGVVSGEKPYPVQFAMYMAATDVKPRTCRKDVGSSSRSTTYSPQLAARDSGSASDVVSLRASDLGGGSLESHQSVEVIRQGETVTACDLVDHQSRDGSCISAGTLATSTSTGTTVCPAHQTLVNQTASSFSAYAPTPSPSSNVDGLVVPATPQEKSMATSGVAGVKRSACGRARAV